MSRLLSRRELDAQRFAPAALERLFAFVLVDDDVTLTAALPPRIVTDHDPALLADCFRICRQLWQEGADLAMLGAAVARARRDGDLDVADRLHFKHIRAKLKLFRFTHALFDASHRYPTMINHLTTALGHLQDALKTGQRRRARHKAWVTGLLLAPPAAAFRRREEDRLQLVDAAQYRDYVRAEIARLGCMVRRTSIVGADFHAMRKIISRQVAFYTAARTLRPGDYHASMFAALATINGMMGDLHDELVMRRADGSQDYHRDQFPIPPEIMVRLEAVVAAHQRE